MSSRDVVGLVTEVDMRTATTERVALKSCWPYLLVSDLERTAAFCRRRLGFEVAYEEPDHDFAIYCRDNVYLMLRQTRHNPASLVNSRFHPGEFVEGITPCIASIQVSDVEALHDELVGRGAPVSPIATLPFGRETTVRLPDGYVLAFLQLGAA